MKRLLFFLLLLSTSIIWGFCQTKVTTSTGFLQEADLTSKRISTVVEGEIVTLGQQVGDFWEVTYKNKKGYIHKSCLPKPMIPRKEVANTTQPVETLTNESILEMFTKKLPNSIILSKIKVGKNSFDTSTDALVSLTQKQLPEDIINAIVEASVDNMRHIVQIDPNNPMDLHEPGIYYFKNNGGEPELIQLEPTVYSQTKSSGVLLSAVTYGVSKVKMSFTLNGTNAQFQVSEKQPEFYFYFDESGNKSNKASNWFFSVATNPNEFVLVALNQKEKTREVTIGSANIEGSSSGVDDENKANYKVEKIGSGIYRVFFETPLSGEFCFMYVGNVPSGYDPLNKVFDFGVK
jgi:hypothetical protein